MLGDVRRRPRRRRRLPPSVAALLSFAFLSCSAVVAAKELDAVPSAKLVVSDSGEWTFGPDDFAAADPIIADGSVAGAAAPSLSFPLSSPSVDHQTVIFVNMASTAPPPPQTGQQQEQQAAPVTSPANHVTSPHPTDDGAPAAGQSQSQMPTSQPSASPLSSSTATAGTGESGGGDAGLAPTPTPESSGKGGSSGGNGGTSTSASSLTSESPSPADVGVAATSAVPSATKADLSSSTQSFASAKTDNGGPNTNIALSQTPPESLPGGTTSNDNGAFAAGTQVPAPITEVTPEPARGSKGDGFESLGPSPNAATTNGDSSSTSSPPDFVSPTGSNAAVGVSADPSKTDTSAIEPVTVDQTADSGVTTTTPTVTQRTSATKNDAVVEASSSGGGVSTTPSTSPPAIVVAAKSPNPTPGTEGGDSSTTGTGPPATSVPAETPNPTSKTKGGVTSTSPATSPPAIVVAAVSSNPTPEANAGASATGVTGPANTTPASVGGNKGGLAPATTQPAFIGTSQQSDSGGVIIGAPIGGGSAPADSGSAGTGAPLTTASSSVGIYAPVYYTDAVGTSAVSVAVTKAPSYYTDAARSSSISTAVTEAPPPVPSVVAIAPPSTQPPSSGGDETIFVSFGGTTAAPLTTAGLAASTATAPLAAATTTGAPIDVAVSALSPTPVIEGGNNNNSLTSVILAPPQEPVAQVSPLPSSSPPAVPVKPTTDGETIIVAGESPAPSPSTRPSPVPETPVVPVNGNVTSDPTPTPSAADSKTSNGDAEGVNGATPSENNTFGTRKTGRGFAAGMGVLGTLLLLLLAVCLFFACFRGNKYSYYSGPSQDVPRGKGSYDTGPSQAAAARPRDNGATLDEWGYNDTERIDDMTGGGAGGFDRRSDDGSETQGISRDQARATFDTRETSGGGGRDRGSSDEYEYDSFTATEQAPAGNRRSTYRYDSRETDPVAADLVPPSRPAPSPPPPPPPLPPSLLGGGMERPGVPPPPPPPLLPPRRPGGSLSQANVTAASSQAPFEPLRRQFAEPPSVAQPALMDSFEGCRSTTPPGTTNEPVSSGAQGRREDAGPNVTGGEVESESAVVSESSYAVSKAKGCERVYSGDAQCEEDQAPWPYFGADDSASSSGDDIDEERSKPTSLREGTENSTKEKENVEWTKQPNPFLLMDRVDFAKRSASSSPVGMEGTAYIPLPDSGPLISYLRGKRPMSTSSRKSANDEGSETSRSVVQTSAAELRRMREPFVKQQAARLSSEEDSSTASTGDTRQQKSALRDTPKCPIEWLPRSDGSQVT